MAVAYNAYVPVPFFPARITSGPTTDYKADRHTSKQAHTTVFGSLHQRERILRRRTMGAAITG